MIAFRITNSTLISIHAPARGATFTPNYKLPMYDISIHAPARGATRTMTMPSGFVKYFNPRSREGSDGILRTVRTKIIMISIHAPARGATCRTIHFYNSNNISIHAPARGATHFSSVLDRPIEFQSTLPRGERQQK